MKPWPTSPRVASLPVTSTSKTHAQPALPYCMHAISPTYAPRKHFRSNTTSPALPPHHNGSFPSPSPHSPCIHTATPIYASLLHHLTHPSVRPASTTIPLVFPLTHHTSLLAHCGASRLPQRSGTARIQQDQSGIGPCEARGMLLGVFFLMRECDCMASTIAWLQPIKRKQPAA